MNIRSGEMSFQNDALHLQFARQVASTGLVSFLFLIIIMIPIIISYFTFINMHANMSTSKCVHDSIKIPFYIKNQGLKLINY